MNHVHEKREEIKARILGCYTNTTADVIQKSPEATAAPDAKAIVNVTQPNAGDGDAKQAVN